MTPLGLPTPNLQRIRKDLRWPLRRRWLGLLSGIESAVNFVSIRNLADSIYFEDLDPWGREDHEPRPAFRFLSRIAWKIDVLKVILRVLFTGRADDCSAFPWWEMMLYRAKATVCLLLGLHDSRWSERRGHVSDSFTLLEWNWRRCSYEYDEYDCDTLEVGYGFRNWYVELNVSSF